MKLFNLILDDPKYRLNEFAPRSSSPLNYHRRKKNTFSISKSEKDRLGNHLIVNSCLNEH